MSGLGFQRVGDAIYFYAVTGTGEPRRRPGWDGFQAAVADYVMNARGGWFELLSQVGRIADLRPHDLGMPQGWKFEALEATNAVRVVDPAGVLVAEDAPSIAAAVAMAQGADVAA